jgi:hypothetical protein
VAEVARRVERLLLRAQHERGERALAAPRPLHVLHHEPADLPHGLARLLRAHVLGQRRRRDVERLELLGQPLGGRRVGRFVHAVERGHLTVREVAGNLLVREDHQLLDRAVRLRLLLVVRRHYVAAVVELEDRLVRLDRQRAALDAALVERSGQLARER